MIRVTARGSAPGEEKHYFCGLCVCLGQDVGLLFLRVNSPTNIACLSWAGRLQFWKQTWLVHGFCWAIINSFILYHSPFSLIKCLISYYLLPNNDFWLCRIPQTMLPQLVGLCSPPSHKIPPCPLGCWDDLLALLSPWLVPFCLEFGRTIVFRNHLLPFHLIWTLSSF